MVSKAKSSTSVEDAITWRDGIHITGTSIWCDALRTRDICFVSAATTLHGARHGQLIATPDTLRLLHSRNSADSQRSMEAPLAVPFGHPFTLGTHRLELFSSGFGLGASSLLIQGESQKTLFAGAINPHGSELGGAIDHRASDILVLSARYGQPAFDFSRSESERGKLGTRCQEICEQGGIAVLLIRNALKSLDAAALLASQPFPVHAHRSFHSLAKLDPRISLSDFAVKRWNAKSKAARVLLWPAQARHAIDLNSLPEKSKVILVSGAAVSPDAVSAAGADEGLVWSDQADFEGLISYIKSSKASQVYLTNAPNRGKELADAMPGVRIVAIGPPKQLHLFGDSV